MRKSYKKNQYYLLIIFLLQFFWHQLITFITSKSSQKFIHSIIMDLLKFIIFSFGFYLNPLFNQYFLSFNLSTQLNDEFYFANGISTFFYYWSRFIIWMVKIMKIKNKIMNISILSVQRVYIGFNWTYWWNICLIFYTFLIIKNI